MDNNLEATDMIDCVHLSIIDCARVVTSPDVYDDVSMAVKLYYFVRDEVSYDPYTHFHKAKYYKASRILRVKRGNCISKAVLLCALARAVGIKARLGFANVKNHLATKQLIEFIGSEVFVFHAYTEFFLNDKWVIATPAFNLNLCLRHNVEPLEFDGYNDSLFQSYNSKDELYMEYVAHHGSFSDVPLDMILSAWKESYGEKKVNGWIEEIERKKVSSNI